MNIPSQHSTDFDYPLSHYYYYSDETNCLEGIFISKIDFIWNEKKSSLNPISILNSIRDSVSVGSLIFQLLSLAKNEKNMRKCLCCCSLFVFFVQLFWIEFKVKCSWSLVESSVENDDKT